VASEERIVVHTIDVIAGEDEHVPRLELIEQVDVLPERVGRSPIPVLAEPLLRGDVLDELAQAVAQEIPPAVEVAREGPRLVLRQHEDPPEIRVDRVGEAEVDDAVDPAERNGGLGAIACQGPQPLALATGEHHRNGVSVH